MINYEEQAKTFLAMAKGRPLAVDTETNAEDIRDGRGYATGVSVAFKEKDTQTYHRHYFPFRHNVGSNYGAETKMHLREVIESAPVIAFHNAKFDLVSLRTLGIYFRGEWYCTMVMAHLIDENWPRAKSLDAVSKHYLGPEFSKDKPKELQSIIDGFGWVNVPVEMMRPYAEQDAELPIRLMEAMWDKFVAEVPREVWDYKRRFIMTIIEMESRGIRLNIPFCEKMADTAQQSMDDYHDMLGGFNPASAKDLNELLCVKLGLPPIMRERVTKDTQTGERVIKMSQTFDKAAMEEYDFMLENMPEHGELAEYVLAFRGWQKAASAFFNSYLKHVSPDGRLRPSYIHHKSSEGESVGGTVTGRLSCQNPNLQQIPKSSDKAWNGRVKESFLPTEGYTLWEVDYSQLELRLATSYAKEEELIETFNDPDRDVFTEMSEAMGRPRFMVKVQVYMTQYSAGPAKIAKVLGISETEARALRDAYYAKYPGFRLIDSKIKSMVMRTKKVRIWSGRFRHFTNPKKEAHKAMNSLIQGGAADIVERQMVRVFEEIDQKSNGEVRMLLTVHDSIWVEITKGREDFWMPQIKAIMEDVGSLGDFRGVHFAVDAKQLGLAA